MTEQPWRVEDREDIPTLIAPDGREYGLDFDVSRDITEAVALASERAAALVSAVNQAPLVEELVGALRKGMFPYREGRYQPPEGKPRPEHYNRDNLGLHHEPDTMPNICELCLDALLRRVRQAKEGSTDAHQDSG